MQGEVSWIGPAVEGRRLPGAGVISSPAALPTSPTQPSLHRNCQQAPHQAVYPTAAPADLVLILQHPPQVSCCQAQLIARLARAGLPLPVP